MKIRALKTIIDWDADAGRSTIINPGEEDEVSEKFGQRMIDDGMAEPADAAVDADDADEEAESPAEAAAPARSRSRQAAAPID